MKQLRNILLALLGLSACFTSNAQTVVQGTNLNIETYSQYPNTLDGNRGNAIGIDHWLGGNNSLAVGNNDTIMSNANSSIALGSLNRIGGLMAMAMGCNVKIGNIYSIGIGHDLNLTGPSGCMAIGSGIIGSGANPNVFLENSYGNSLLVGFHGTKPTLTIGPSPNDYPEGDTISKTGKVAIGDVPVPDIAAKLHIRSDYGEDAGIILEPKDKENSSTYIQMRDEDHMVTVDDEGELAIRSMNGEVLSSLVLQGRVGINITNESNTYALAVNGGILTNEVFIKNVEEWFDDVFADDYKLMPLNELQRFVWQHGRLPEVPSEEEVMEEGYGMAEMQGVLLKKIEELTLYTLRQQEEIEMLKQMIEELKEK